MLPDLFSNPWVYAALVVADILLAIVFITWVLMSKSDATSAVAWCLLISFLPFFGSLFFLMFGYQHVRRPLNRKKRHRSRYHDPPPPRSYAEHTRTFRPESDAATASLAPLAQKFDGSPVTDGNAVDFYADGPPAFEAMVEAIRAARHHIHLEFFIVHPDQLGERIMVELVQKAQSGVQVRLLYDAIGSLHLTTLFLAPLHEAGGQTSAFLSLSLWRRRFQLNMRNHRKLLIVDGEVGFIGGLNIGDEYMGLNKYFGYWRDTHLKIRGPAVYDLQRVFVEDWDFAADEQIKDADENGYFRAHSAAGPYRLQIIDSGPDQEIKCIREVTFAAILKAKKRLWIATPYFVPDSGLLDALRLAAYSGVDVRILCQLKPDHWLPQFAARYYFPIVMAAGIKIYQYAKGMMHAKVMIVDDEFASVGTANLDNRSMHLNFEVNCLFYGPEAVMKLEAMFVYDFENAKQLDPVEFAKRPFLVQLAENACRLLSPVL